MEITDNELIIRYRAGDSKAFELLIERHATRIHYFVQRLVGAAEAPDVAQEVWIKVWKYSNRFDVEKSFKTWLFRIARNTCFDYLRKKRPLVFSSLRANDEDESFEDTLLDNRPSAQEIVLTKEMETRLDATLAELPISMREVFVLYYKENLSLPEIAEVLETSVNTIKSRHHRGLQKLRTLIDPKLL